MRTPYYSLTLLVMSYLLSGISESPGALRINEFVASNSNFEDGDGNTSDWIEIYNGDSSAVDISGYYLTDSNVLPQKWAFPAGTILSANEYRIVFASGQVTDAAGNLRASFSLSSDGEYLALIEPDGSTVVQEFSPSYPPQKSNVSYTAAGFLSTPTPGEANVGVPLAGYVEDTMFTIDRGFFTDPMSVEISTLTPGAVIYCTTDGSAPSEINGTVYQQAIDIATTTVLRAAAFKTDFIPTNVDTQTYIYLSDVLQQGNSPPNTTTTWAERPADYEMDPGMPTSWRASTTVGGNPGTSDATIFAGSDSAALLA